MKALAPARVRLARIFAICADLIQIGIPYIFGEGIFSPFDAALDVVMCVTLTLVVGWHVAFIPTFLVEGLPLADLAPTWTIAVFIATRTRRARPSVTKQAVAGSRDGESHLLPAGGAGSTNQATTSSPGEEG